MGPRAARRAAGARRARPGRERRAALPGRSRCYREAHIPGAAFVDWRADFTDRSDPVPVQLASPDDFAADATRLGVGNDSVVVADDTYRNVLAGRVVWAFRAYGHRHAHVLDGRARRLAGGRRGAAKRRGAPAPSPPDPTGQRDDSLWDIDRMRATLDGGVLAIDARAHDEYAGVETHARRAGHIPGAVNVPYRSLLRDDGRFSSGTSPAGLRRCRHRCRGDRPPGGGLLQRRRLGDGRRQRARGRRRAAPSGLRRLVERSGATARTRPSRIRAWPSRS